MLINQILLFIIQDFEHFVNINIVVFFRFVQQQQNKNPVSSENHLIQGVNLLLSIT